jgi:hypothetical protein
MSFQEQFESFFTSEERESEIYKILSIIGVNTEKTILEEIDKEMRHATELMTFGEAKLRSWLAYFLRRVRNVSSARGICTISIPDDPDVTAPVVFQAGQMIRGSNGKMYQLMNTVTLNRGQSQSAEVVQGSMAEDTGTYSEFIMVPQVVGVDIDDVEVLLNGVSVSPVQEAFMPGDPSYGYIKPLNGFYAFYHSEKLFVKIFRGDDVREVVSLPYTVRYRVSDGVYGNLGQNGLEAFVDDMGLDPNSHEPIPYYITNEPITGGANPPDRAELVNMLRQKFFVTTNVASVPEYSRWFLSQPSVGDCVVVSDFSKAMKEGVASVSGLVDVFLLDHQKNVFTEWNTGEVGVPGPLRQELNKVRDLAEVRFRRATRVLNFFLVQYRSTSNDALFMADAVDALRNFYTLSILRQNGMSLFDDLDVELVHVVLGQLHSPAGLRVIPHHYLEYSIPVSFNGRVPLTGYTGEAVGGGWYELWEVTGSGDLTNEVLAYSFKEFIQPNGDILIFEVDGRLEGEIFRYTEAIGSSVGSREGSIINIYLSYLDLALDTGSVWKMCCFWPIEKQGTLPVGVEMNELVSVDDYVVGYRDIGVVPGRSREGVVFEKYS